jgi:electron transport complex protein RnfC
MLITKLKSYNELIPCFSDKVFVIKCSGCKEVYLPEEEIDIFLEKQNQNIISIKRLDYLCNEDFSRTYSETYNNFIEKSDVVVIFSCGVGVQVISKILEYKKVFAGCDTNYINGFQGISAQSWDCRQCGECYLNYTGGICPITACSKHLLNGPCGGYKNGKCEVNSEMDCGWVMIYNRLLKQKKQEKLITKCRIRNYKKYISTDNKISK